MLTSQLMDAAQRLAKQCGARGGRTLASFVGKGRGALPVQPGAAMMAHYLGDTGTKLEPLQQGAAGEQVSAIAIRAEATEKADGPGGPRGHALLVPGTLQLGCST